MLVLTRQSTYLPAVLCYRAQMVVERALPSLLHLFRTSGGPSQQLPTPLLYSGGENFVGTRSYGAQRAADSDRSQACLAKCRLALFNQVQQERMSHMSIGSPASAAKVSRAYDLLPLSARYAVMGPAGCDMKPLFENDRLLHATRSSKPNPDMLQAAAPPATHRQLPVRFLQYSRSILPSYFFPTLTTSPIKGRTRQAVWRTAIHESGHAVAGWLLNPALHVYKVTIMPHLNNEVPTWGHTGFAKQTNSYNYKDVLKDIICALMAGTAAEEVMLGNEAGGGLADIIQGSITAKVLLTTGWFYKLLWPVCTASHWLSGNQQPLDRLEAKAWEFTSILVGKEVVKQQMRDLLQEQRMRAKELLSQHRDKVVALAHELMRKQELDEKDLERILGERPSQVWYKSDSLELVVPAALLAWSWRISKSEPIKPTQQLLHRKAGKNSGMPDSSRGSASGSGRSVRQQGSMQLQDGRRRYTQAKVPHADASGARALPWVPGRLHRNLVVVLWIGHILAHWSVSDRWRRLMNNFFKL